MCEGNRLEWHGNVHPRTGYGARCGGWPAPRPVSPPPPPPGGEPVPIVQEAGWAPGPVWTGAENLASTATRSPGRPARSGDGVD
jgi:hypothetical protein